MLTQDVNTLATVALPAANANVDTPVIDLRTNGAPLGTVPNLGLLVKVDSVLGNLADSHAVTITLKHCSTSGGSFVPIPGVGNLTLTGAGGVGASTFDGMPGLEVELTLPRHTLGFIKANVAVANGGGDNTAANLIIAGRI